MHLSVPGLHVYSCICISCDINHAPDTPPEAQSTDGDSREPTGRRASSGIPNG